MDNSQFKAFIKSIHNAYGRKSPDGEVLDFIWTRIHHIPASSLEWIENRFMSTNDKFPGKLHLAILSCWYEWRNEHPDKTITRRHQCKNPSCINGVLHVQRYEEMYSCQQEYTANCGDCKYIEGSKLPYMTMVEAGRLGFSPAELEEPKPSKSPEGFFKHLVDNWGATAAKIRHEDMERRRERHA
jgi:hypothetical protein